MTTAPQAIPLSQSEVQAALRLAGLPPGPDSPFAQLQPPASLHPAVAAALQTKQVVNSSGIVSDVWKSALTTLTAPSHRVAIRLGSPTHWLSTVYYGSPGGIAGFVEDQAEYRITLGCTHDAIQAPLADWLHWGAVPDTAASTHDLRMEELTAIAAIVDASREETLRAMLDRRSPSLDRFTRDQLLYETTSADSPDSRWLCGLLKQHSPQSAAPAASQLDLGVRMLAERGWVALEPAALAIADNLRAIALSMANLNPYVVIDCRGPNGAASTLILTTGLRAFWAVELSGPPAAPVARLSSLGGPGAGQRIASYLNWLPVPPAPASWTAPVPVQAPQPSWTPPSPPTPMPAPAPAPVRTHCTKCGKALLPGRSFCTGCGAPIR